MADPGACAATWRRWRWRLRGASMWPAFAVGLVADVLLLRDLPPSGVGESPVDAFVLAGFLNLAVVAVLAPMGGLALRRRRKDLPRVVAADYAGTALLLSLVAVLLIGGVLHHPAVETQRRAFQAQSDAMRRYVARRAPPVYRRNVDRADSVRVDGALYRTCVPGPDPSRALCLFIDTSRPTPTVRVDPDQAPNWRYFNRRPGDFATP